MDGYPLLAKSHKIYSLSIKRDQNKRIVNVSNDVNEPSPLWDHAYGK